MIQNLRATALLGTSREPVPSIATDSELDPLLAALAGEDRERRLLLTAGTLAVWQRAGHAPVSVAAPEPAPADTLPGCSDEAAALIKRLLRPVQRPPGRQILPGVGLPTIQPGLPVEHEDLLPEALGLLRRRNERLRYHLLPDLLAARTPELRGALRPVLGERGPWLAGFKPTWVWAAGALPDYADWLWERGKPEFRRDLLELERRIDPAGARARLATRLATDRADVRLTLLSALETGLSADDEPLLESVLDLGGAAVRRKAAQLLALLPGSACAERMRARADTMLRWAPRAWGRGRIEIEVPTELDPAWRREGLERGPQLPGIDTPADWLLHTIGLVPTRHWETSFELPLEVLLDRLEGERIPDVLEGWTHAAVLHGERAAYPVLWDAWWERRHIPPRSTNLLAAVWSELAGGMDPPALGRRLASLLADPPRPDGTCGAVLAAVPWPWPEEVVDAALRLLGDLARGEGATGGVPDPRVYALLPVARGLPAGAIGRALEVLSAAPLDDALPSWLRDMLDVATHRLELRQQIIAAMKQ